MVNLEAEIKLNEYENVLGGYTGLLTFRLANLCVKSDPASLLVVSVDVFGKKNNIEDVSKVGVLSDEKMDVYPFHEDLLPMIGKAIAEVHPEFESAEAYRRRLRAEEAAEALPEETPEEPTEELLPATEQST